MFSLLRNLSCFPRGQHLSSDTKESAKWCINKLKSHGTPSQYLSKVWKMTHKQKKNPYWWCKKFRRLCLNTCKRSTKSTAQLGTAHLENRSVSDFHQKQRWIKLKGLHSEAGRSLETKDHCWMDPSPCHHTKTVKHQPHEPFFFHKPKAAKLGRWVTHLLR